MTQPLPLLVFSDLDGTLLDHKSYDWTAAQPGLDRLRALGAGLVLASSKTAAEMEPLRDALGFAEWPMIVENGAGVLAPGEEAVTASDYARIRAALADLPKGFVGFGDMMAREVAERTGLSLPAAEDAKARQFSEPGLWTGAPDALDSFLLACDAVGLTAIRGGRFLTLSFGRTKADAMKEVAKELYPARTIALGDAPNDIAMIKAADFGVIVRNPSGTVIPPLAGEAAGSILRTTEPGPKGWAAAILSLTHDLFPKSTARYG